VEHSFPGVLTVSTLAILLTAGVARTQSQAGEAAEVRYLAFQVFTGAPDPTIPIGGSGVHPLGSMPPQAELDAFVQDVIQRIGTVGGGQTQLAVIFGPLAFDHSDAEVERFVETAFAIAQERQIAVGFHIDDSMFWARRSDTAIAVGSTTFPLKTARTVTGQLRILRLAPELVPKSLEAALVDHLVEFFPIWVEFEAPLPNFVLLDLDVDSGQVAAEDQDADPIRHALEIPHHFPGIDHGSFVAHWTPQHVTWNIPMVLPSASFHAWTAWGVECNSTEHS